MQPNQESTPDLITDAELLELDTLYKNATAGPWAVRGNLSVQCEVIGTMHKTDDAYPVAFAVDGEDAVLISKLRNALPGLLARLAAAEATVAAGGAAASEQDVEATFFAVFKHWIGKPSAGSQAVDAADLLVLLEEAGLKVTAAHPAAPASICCDVCPSGCVGVCQQEGGSHD